MLRRCLARCRCPKAPRAMTRIHRPSLLALCWTSRFPWQLLEWLVCVQLFWGMVGCIFGRTVGGMARGTVGRIVSVKFATRQTTGHIAIPPRAGVLSIWVGLVGGSVDRPRGHPPERPRPSSRPPPRPSPKPSPKTATHKPVTHAIARITRRLCKRLGRHISATSGTRYALWHLLEAF